MKLLFYDTETTGLDVQKDRALELAWALYDTCPILGLTLLNCASYLIRWDDEFELSQEAEEAHGISKKVALENGKFPLEVCNLFLFNMNYADFIVGHNAIEYDKPLLLNDLHFAEGKRFLKVKPHLDTMFDLPYPKRIRSRDLEVLGIKHKYVSMGAHRAIHDVFTCAHIFNSYKLSEVLEIGSTDLLRMTLDMKFPKDEVKQKIYGAGFRWDPVRRVYEKKAREFYLKQIEKSLGFAISGAEVIQSQDPKTEKKKEIQQEFKI